MILHCNGDPAEMAAVAEATPRLAGRSAERAEAALARRVAPADFDVARADGGVRGGDGGGACLTTSSMPSSTEARLVAEALVIDVDGFEGPLDLLLTLARTQKVDLRRISILRLAEQYLGFVEAAKRLRIELAADYLVMAAWLAFLKSRLLLPPDPAEEGPSGEELAARLAFQLERLEAMRDAAARLMARDQLGRDVFARGETEKVHAGGAGHLDREPRRADAGLRADQDEGRLHAAASAGGGRSTPWSRRSSGCAGWSGRRPPGCSFRRGCRTSGGGNRRSGGRRRRRASRRRWSW